MSFPKYPVYKESGVECLGEVPIHWEVKQLRHCLQDSCGLKIGPFGSQLTSDMLVPEGFKVYGQENVIAKDFVRGERFIPSDKFSDMNVYRIEEGDILVTMMGSSGQCAVVPNNIEAGIMDSHLLRIKINENSFVEYVAILLSESNYVQYQFQCLGKGSIMHGLNSSIIKQVIIAQPPLGEQSTIAAFLNRETAKIDALVAEQEKLIELLKENRQTVISHAVTKGLDPNIPMKDSGVEWLGEVPEHWVIRQLGAVSMSIQTGPFGSQLHADEYVQEQIPVINPSNIKNESIVPADDLTVTPDTAQMLHVHKFELGDIVFGRRGEMGRCAVVSKNEVGWICGTGSLKVRPDRSYVNSYYLTLFLRTPFVRERLVLESVGSTMDNLNTEILARLKILKPPLEEQEAISKFIEEQQNRIDELIGESQRAIDLLKERRSALISAAVTGKIDVRGLAEATH